CMGNSGIMIATQAKASRRLCSSSTQYPTLLFLRCCFPVVDVIARRDWHDAVSCRDLLFNLLFESLHLNVLPEQFKVLNLIRPLLLLEDRFRRLIIEVLNGGADVQTG